MFKIHLAIVFKLMVVHVVAYNGIATHHMFDGHAVHRVFLFLCIVYQTAKMSASPIARQATQPQGQAIPRRILINDASQLPHDYSSTPNGTLYSTTPGGMCDP